MFVVSFEIIGGGMCRTLGCGHCSRRRILIEGRGGLHGYLGRGEEKGKCRWGTVYVDTTSTRGRSGGAQAGLSIAGEEGGAHLKLSSQCSGNGWEGVEFREGVIGKQNEGFKKN
jgi:hypothetical protein